MDFALLQSFHSIGQTCGFNRGIAIIGTVAAGVSAGKGKVRLGFDVNHRDTDTAVPKAFSYMPPATFCKRRAIARYYSPRHWGYWWHNPLLAGRWSVAGSGLTPCCSRFTISEPSTLDTIDWRCREFCHQLRWSFFVGSFDKHPTTGGQNGWRECWTIRCYTSTLGWSAKANSGLLVEAIRFFGLAGLSWGFATRHCFGFEYRFGFIKSIIWVRCWCIW